MNLQNPPLSRATAAEYATWFKALADASRIQIVSLLARHGEPMNVGEIVAAVQVGQSTVSAHLKVLAEVGFVLAEHRGTASYYRINDACVECFPTAADIVMGRSVPGQPVTAAAHSHQEPKMSDHPASISSIRDAVIDRYSGLARTALAGAPAADCDADAFAGGCFGAAAYPATADAPDAALRASLGCGNPLAVADLRPGETVLDLGSGGGLDVLLSARRVGPAGTAYGLDASADMLTLARANAAQAGLANATFLHGHIEDIPLPAEQVDVIISNCVINLSADKPRAMAEAFRVLRPGGRLGISDVIADDGLDPGRRAEAEKHVGCSSGTLTRPEYHGLLTAAGFTGISITITHDAGDGLHSAIIQAIRPPGRDRGQPRSK
jgi:arsenite methyltransferase